VPGTERCQPRLRRITALEHLDQRRSDDDAIDGTAQSLDLRAAAEYRILRTPAPSGAARTRAR
jgi:hypothetical protein